MLNPIEKFKSSILHLNMDWNHWNTESYFQACKDVNKKNLYGNWNCQSLVTENPNEHVNVIRVSDIDVKTIFTEMGVSGIWQHQLLLLKNWQLLSIFWQQM